MKRIVIFFLVTVFSFLFYSCDLTNDKVKENPFSNEVTVDTTASEAPSRVLQFDTLRINPVITQSETSGESNLSYEWTVRTDERFINSPKDEEVTVISHDKNLEYYVALTTGDWKFVCKVTDENSGVTYFGYYYVTVQNQFSEGWLILEDTGSRGDLSIILPDGSIFNGIYSDLNPGVPLNTPLRQLEITNFAYGTDEITILSENSGVQLDYSELVKLSEYPDWFWNVPDTIDPEYHIWLGTQFGWVINGGEIHLQVRGGFPGDTKYGGAMAFPGDVGNDYEAAPFVAEGPSYGGPYPAVLYDNKGQYFVTLAGGLSPVLRNFPSASPGAPFDMNDVGLEMVYMETANKAYLINAVMKDESDVYYMLQFRTDQSDAAQSYQVMATPDIENHTAFESSQTLERMYYSVANQIYLYDIPSGLIIGSPYSLPAGETVTHMEIDSNAPSEMMVATWDGSKGRVYSMDLSGTGELSLDDQYDGFGEIIDLDYKD